MEVFRLVREEYAAVLNGKGAALKGARWNSPGTELIYTAGNRSLAMAEVAVHLSWALLPDDFRMLVLELPDDLPIQTLEEKELPDDWNVFPPLSATMVFGDRFVAEGKAAVLKVPSVVTRGDFNYLINPHHSDFKKIRIIESEPFLFDRRLFQ